MNPVSSVEQTRKFMNEHALIEPPSNSDRNVSKREYRYIIDSRDRNLEYFPDPSKYDIPLSEDITDVQSVELVTFDVPFTKYLINEYNNVLEYALIGENLRYDSRLDREGFSLIFIDYGTYTLEELVEELNKQNPHPSTTFGYSKTKNKITIKTTGGEGGVILTEGNMLNNPDAPPVRSGGYDHTAPTYYVADYRYKGHTKSPLVKILGLKPNENFRFTGDQEVNDFPYQVDLRPDRYIAMHLGQTSLNFSENTSTNKCFAIIKKDDLDSKYMDITYKKYYNPPIPAMRTLRISFTDYDGNPYDFQNKDHLIELKFVCFKNQRKYNDIF